MSNNITPNPKSTHSSTTSQKAAKVKKSVNLADAALSVGAPDLSASPIVTAAQARAAAEEAMAVRAKGVADKATAAAKTATGKGARTTPGPVEPKGVETITKSQSSGKRIASPKPVVEKTSMKKSRPFIDAEPRTRTAKPPAAVTSLNKG